MRVRENTIDRNAGKCKGCRIIATDAYDSGFTAAVDLLKQWIAVDEDRVGEARELEDFVYSLKPQ